MNIWIYHKSMRYLFLILNLIRRGLYLLLLFKNILNNVTSMYILPCHAKQLSSVLHVYDDNVITKRSYYQINKESPIHGAKWDSWDPAEMSLYVRSCNNVWGRSNFLVDSQVNCCYLWALIWWLTHVQCPWPSMVNINVMF